MLWRVLTLLGAEIVPAASYRLVQFRRTVLGREIAAPSPAARALAPQRVLENADLWQLES
jgi:hypothetical protein